MTIDAPRAQPDECFAWIPDDEDEGSATVYRTGDPEWAAEQCAAHACDSNGEDWHDSYTVSVRCPDGVVRSYLVYAEMEPSFSVKLINASVG